MQRELIQKIEDLPLMREKSRSARASSSSSSSSETSEMLETVSDLDIESEMQDKVPSRDGLGQ